MINKYIEFSKRPLNAFFQIVLFFFFVPLSISLYFGSHLLEKVGFFIVSLLIIIAIAEIVFIFIYRLFSGSSYEFLENIDFKKLMNEPHPYLPYIYKKNFKGTRTEQVNYPLSSNFWRPELATNSMGYFNGPNGDRDIVIPKPEDLVRINCLGASTTGNYLRFENKNYSYPLELEEILKKKINKNLEVNNCAQGGYNSADLLVRFILESIDTKPDYIIIYHAYNDIRSYLTPEFKSDYFHSRKNLGEDYWKFLIGSKIPNLPIKFINYLKNKFLFPGNEQYSLLEVIAKGKLDYSIDYSKGLKTYERNLQHVIDLSIGNNIKVILCTFCIYLHPKIKDDKVSILYKKIVLEENKILKNLAKKNNLELVDSYSLIEQNDINFVDSIHFTPKGMNLLAKHVSEKIKIQSKKF